MLCGAYIIYEQTETKIEMLNNRVHAVWRESETTLQNHENYLPKHICAPLSSIISM